MGAWQRAGKNAMASGRARRTLCGAKLPLAPRCRPAAAAPHTGGRPCGLVAAPPWPAQTPGSSRLARSRARRGAAGRAPHSAPAPRAGAVARAPARLAGSASGYLLGGAQVIVVHALNLRQQRLPSAGEEEEEEE